MAKVQQWFSAAKKILNRVGRIPICEKLILTGNTAVEIFLTLKYNISKTVLYKAEIWWRNVLDVTFLSHTPSWMLHPL